MSIIAHTRTFVIGVDAHARTHALAILACPTAELLDESQFAATAAGLQRAIAWVARRTRGDLDALWVIEGIGTYGARPEVGPTVPAAPPSVDISREKHGRSRQHVDGPLLEGPPQRDELAHTARE